MRYVASVPLEVARPLRVSDPDVQSIRRLPGFVRLEQAVDLGARYTLTLEVEAGSRRDALDATDELLVEFENALSIYGPRQLATASTEAR
jgi:hypothetical protein